AARGKANRHIWHRRAEHYIRGDILKHLEEGDGSRCIQERDGLDADGTGRTHVDDGASNGGTRIAKLIIRAESSSRHQAAPSTFSIPINLCVTGSRFILSAPRFN